MTSDELERSDVNSSFDCSDEDTISEEELDDMDNDDKHMGVTNEALQVDVEDNETQDFGSIHTAADENQHIECEGPAMESDSRYPRRERNKPPKWFMETTAHGSQMINVTTGDDTTIREEMNATLEEQRCGNLHSTMNLSH